MHNYFSFLIREARWLAFGFLLTLISSLGQTFFISLFGAEIRGDLGLSHAEFGNFYAIGTITGGLVIFWAGRQIDHVPLHLFTGITLLGLVIAGTLLAAADHWLMLIAAFIMLRLCGQGLASHIAMTSMGRWYAQNRGKAISVANLGMPLGEALLPIIVVVMLASLGWRQSWWLFSLIILCGLVPVTLALIWRGERIPKSALDLPDHGAQLSWQRIDVARDLRFWLMLPAVMGPAWIFTGIFFHQVPIIEAKGWAFSAFAVTYLAYALGKVAFALMTGILVDRFTARKLAPWTMPVMSLSLLWLITIEQSWGAWLMMATLGIHVGMHMTAVSALWAELYGRRYLGAIKAMVMSFGVIASAIGPPIFGFVLDAGSGTEALMWFCLIYGLAAAALMHMALRLKPLAQPAG